MPEKTPVVFEDDNPEWTKADFAKARPASELLPASLVRGLVRTRRPQKKPTKIPVSIRLSADVVDHFKAGGPGWQSRLDATLRKVLFSKLSP